MGDSNVPDEDCIKVLNNGVVLNAEDMFATFITLRESYDCIWRRVKTYYEQYLVQYYRGLHAGESTLSSHSYSSKQLHVEFLNRRISEETLAAEANKNREINSISFVNRCDLCMKQVVAVTIKYFLNRLANVNGLGNPMWESDCGVVREYIHKARKHAITKLREYSAHIKNNEQTMIATFPLIHQLHMALGSKKENDFEVLSLVYRLVIDLMLRSEPSVKSTGIETRFMNEYWQEISEALMHSRT